MLAKAVQNFAVLIDEVVVAVSKWHPLVRWVLKPILYPFFRWRMRDISLTLAHDCRWLPTTSWKDIEKHGENVVYCRRDKRNVYTKVDEEFGAWIVDNKNKTVRTVTDLPDEYKQTGKTF